MDLYSFQLYYPGSLFGTEGRACATYGELSKGAVHPRYYGTYPRILSLEEAIRKATKAVAKHFGIEQIYLPFSRSASVSRFAFNIKFTI